MLSTDAMDPFEYLFIATSEISPLLPSTLEATVRRSHNRAEDTATDHTAIEETWNKLTKRNDGEPQRENVYNGLKFRLHGVVQEGNKCSLQLGLTDYKSSLGTTRNIGMYAELAKRKGVLLENYLANALGVECFTLTSDGMGVLFCRSESVSEYPGFFCFPGGHAEPNKIFNWQHFKETHSRDTSTIITTTNNNNSNNNNNNNNKSSSSLLNEAAGWFEYVTTSTLVDLLFDAATMEVADELGVEPTSCSNKGLLSVVRNVKSRKPDVCFFIQLSLNASEVKKCFNSRRGADAFESIPNSLRLIDLNMIKTEEAARCFVEEKLQGKLTPASFACLLHGIKYI
ncbi:putative nucleoside diphosphate-linked moiety X motif 22-like [Trypanosoma theileri]|uniref:Putative nucleoside diphosphate-linked moiety X motif 22-like n=1 Tax=Trypanosoma theileri TaxID=67003 RepID=A0A1X0P2E2_9TRYP|nr:putative nucleoside diphosphate-linked moiety X motif 22-like [Trypanosoma theileri]ORC90863.1 putative nucleoside diphosphate-linked moiety X motif 22-like [Trypanosoma theileri]